MVRDYTDYSLIILGWRQNPRTKEIERTYHQEHVRTKNLKRSQIYALPYHGHSYIFNPNRATHMKGWCPWYEWDGKHIFKSLGELMRSKKVGLLVYHEPEENGHE